MPNRQRRIIKGDMPYNVLLNRNDFQNLYIDIKEEAKWVSWGWGAELGDHQGEMPLLELRTSTDLISEDGGATGGRPSPEHQLSCFGHGGQSPWRGRGRDVMNK